MRFLPSIPEEDDKPFLPARSSQHIPLANYIHQGHLVPYIAPSSIDFLPEEAARFDLLLEGQLPMIIAPHGAIQKSKINNQLVVLLNHMNNIQAWDDMLIQLGHLPGQGGKRAGLYLVDRHDRIYLVLDVDFYDRSRRSGDLILEPIGQDTRRKVALNPKKLIDYSTDPPSPFAVPVLLYRGRRNPDKELRGLERKAAQGDKQAASALVHARRRAGMEPQSMEEFVMQLQSIGVYSAVEVNPHISKLYKQDWILSIARTMFTEAAQKLAEEQQWEGGEHAIDNVKVRISEDTSENCYEIEVRISFSAPSADEVDEREGMFQDHFIDWSDERRRDYKVEIEDDNWNTDVEREPDESQFDERLQELFDDGLDEDEISDMDGPDVPQSARIELTQRLGLHHIFAIMTHNGMDAEELGLIPDDKPCSFCGGAVYVEERPGLEVLHRIDTCNACNTTDSEQIPGRLYPNSNRKGYVAGEDWAVQID